MAQQNEGPSRIPVSPGSGKTGEPPALALEFRGSASEYFGIWLVNLLLSLITLGIWSAWAKVRRIRYFYGNTRLDGHAFDYLADGWMLLKGRLIAVAVIALYASLELIDPFVQIIATFFFIPLYPFIINRSLRFQARMTVWRNVRLNWQGDYMGTFKAYVLWPLAAVLSVGLAAPAAARAASLYLTRNYRFGTAEFAAEASLKEFYKAFLLTIAYFMAMAFMLGGPLFGIGAVLRAEGVEGFGPEFLLPIAMFIAGATAASYYFALTRNIVLNGLTLSGGHGFHSTLPGLGYSWITLSNFLATILSLGLLRPWAAVRAWRYQADHLAALPAGPLDTFVDDQSKAGGAFGEEFSDLEGFDIGV